MNIKDFLAQDTRDQVYLQEIHLHNNVSHFVTTLRHLGLDDDSIGYKLLSAIDDNTSEDE